MARRVVGEKEAKESETEPDRSEHEVLPRGLERVAAPEERDEQRGRQRRRLDRDPHEAEVVKERNGEHGPDRQLEPDVEPAHLRGGDLAGGYGVAHVSERVESRDRRHERDNEDDEPREGIDVEEAPKRAFRGCRERAEREGEA